MAEAKGKGSGGYYTKQVVVRAKDTAKTAMKRLLSVTLPLQRLREPAETQPTRLV